MKARYYILILSFLLGCVEDDLRDKKYPLLKTLDVSNVTADGATFNATTINPNGADADEYGFIWDQYSYTLRKETAQWKAVGKNGKIKSFSLDVTHSLEKDTYYVVSYAVYGDKTIYGNVVSFSSLGSSAPEITEIAPTTGFRKDTIAVSGIGFGFNKASITVKFNEKVSSIVSATDTLLKVIVPDELTDHESKVSVTFGNKVASSSQLFELKNLVVSGFDRSSVSICDTLTISGYNFPSDAAGLQVQFNDKDAKVISTTANIIKAIVPYLLSSTTSVSVKVKSGSEEVVLSNRLTLKKTSIHLISERYNYQDTVGFEIINPIKCNTTFMFDNTPITPIKSSHNYFEIVIPINNLNYSPELKLVSDGNILASVDLLKGFNVDYIETSMLGPDLGDTLILHGVGFHPTANKNIVYFNRSSYSAAFAASKTQIKVKIPENLLLPEDGSAQLGLEVGGVTQDNVGYIQIMAPIIQSITPVKATLDAGDQITIIGDHFSSDKNNIELINKYTYKPLTCISASRTKLVFEVTAYDLYFLPDQPESYNTTLELSVAGQKVNVGTYSVEYNP